MQVFAAEVLRAKPFEVGTPTAVVGMRGTGFDSGFTGAANDGSTRVEVVEAGFRFDASAKPVGADLGIAVAAGFGATRDAADGPLGLAKRVNAPDLAGLPERVEEPLVRFSLPVETTALRVHVTADPGFDGIISAQRLAPGAWRRTVHRRPRWRHLATEQPAHRRARPGRL